MRENKRLQKEGIPMDRHMELRYFCRQYAYKKQNIKEMTFISGVSYRNMPRGNGHSSPTEERAIKMLSLKKDIEMIEQSAIEASSILYNLIIRNVTEGIDYTYLDAPCGKHYFYKMVENFYIILDKKRM